MHSSRRCVSSLVDFGKVDNILSSLGNVLYNLRPALCGWLEIYSWHVLLLVAEPASCSVSRPIKTNMWHVLSQMAFAPDDYQLQKGLQAITLENPPMIKE